MKPRIKKIFIISALLLIVILIYVVKKTETAQNGFTVNDGWTTFNHVMTVKPRNWVALANARNIPLTSNPGKITILMYHQIKNPPNELSVPPANFAEQMKYLHDHDFHPITLAEFYEYKLHNRLLPVKPIIVTFDDGYRDNYKSAFPILEKYNFQATIFIITNNVGWENYLTWDMIKEMYNSGLIEIGAHTISHPKLTEIPLAQAEKEIGESKKIIQDELGVPVDFFCYPSGLRNQKIIELTKKYGYKGAVIMSNGTKDNRDDKNSDNYVLSRTFVGGSYDLKTFAAKVGQ